MAHERKQVVLVVEDDPDLAAIAVEFLQMEGFAALLAANGHVALSLLDVSRPDVVLLDMMMPVLDGFGFLAEYVKLPGSHRAPVLAVSAFHGYLDKAVEAGATAAMAKPYDIDALAAKLRDLATAAAGAPAEPAAELERLRAIFELKLDQPAPTAALDEFTQTTARLFDVPVALVSIITDTRQYWHASCGLPEDLAAARGTPREDSFCTHAVGARAALVVQDTAQNPFFRDNRLVRERGLRFYAGVPLFTRLGEAVGTLCVLDFQPHATFTYFDLELLGLLGKRVLAELEWRERRARPGSPDAAFRYLNWLDEELNILGRDAFAQVLEVESMRAAERREPLALVVVAVAPERLEAATASLKGAFDRALFGRLGRARVAAVVQSATGQDAGLRAAVAVGQGAVIKADDVPRSARAASLVLAELEAALGAAGLARG